MIRIVETDISGILQGVGKRALPLKLYTKKINLKLRSVYLSIDRKDLDRQTRLEFNKFQEGCVEENTNTGILVKRLTSDDYRDKVIVTTIPTWARSWYENSKHSQEKKKEENLPIKTRSKTQW